MISRCSRVRRQIAKVYLKLAGLISLAAVMIIMYWARGQRITYRGGIIMTLRKTAFWGLGLIVAAVLAFIYWPTHGVPVLAYHKVSNDDSIYSIDKELFDRQMKYLAEHGYTAVSLGQLSDGLTGKVKLPDKSVVITFDDGYLDNYTTALPILEKYGMRAAIFITVDKVGQPGYLSWEQIKALEAREAEIGSHTMSHAPLTDVNTRDCEQEIQKSKTLLDQHLNKPVKFLAYPHGKFNTAMYGLLKAAGYHGAFSGVAGLNFPGTDQYQIKRISILRPKFDIWSFQARLAKANIYSKLGI